MRDWSYEKFNMMGVINLDIGFFFHNFIISYSINLLTSSVIEISAATRRVSSSRLKYEHIFTFDFLINKIII